MTDVGKVDSITSLRQRPEHSAAPNQIDPWPWKLSDNDILVRGTDEYIVYIDKDITLQWDTANDYYNRLRTHKDFDLTQYNTLLCEASVLESGARVEFDENTRIELLCLVGVVIVCVLEIDYSAAKIALSNAKQYLNQRSEEVSRFWYLSSSFGMAICFMCVALIAWQLRSVVMALSGATLVWIILAAGSGATGALLSVILRSGKLAFDSSAGRWLHYLEGSSRIWAGAISGVIVLLALKSGMIFSISGVSNSSQLIILAAVAAGASERLASSIITKIDRSGDDTAPKTARR